MGSWKKCKSGPNLHGRLRCESRTYEQQWSCSPTAVDPIALALHRIALFPLVTNGEHQYNVLALLITIERHIATLAIRDQDFPQPLLTWSADKRMSLKNLYSVANYVDRCDSSL